MPSTTQRRARNWPAAPTILRRSPTTGFRRARSAGACRRCSVPTPPPALPALFFLSRCDGHVDAAENDEIDTFTASWWIRAEIHAPFPEADISAHIRRMAPDVEAFERAAVSDIETGRYHWAAETWSLAAIDDLDPLIAALAPGV